MNKIILKGNLGKDPEMKETKSGKKMVRMSIAVSRRKKVGDSYENATDWFNITWWDKKAESLHKNFWKGKEIIIEGAIQNNNYEKDGQKIYQDQIIGREFFFCGPKGEDPRTSEDESSSSSDDGDEMPF